jgi:long-chain-alcohol oxidase
VCLTPPPPFPPPLPQLVHLITSWTPYDDRVQFIALLHALDTKAGTLALAGPRAPVLRRGRVRSFVQLAPSERETLLLRWLDGPLPPLVQAVKGLKCLVFMVLFRFVDPATGVNPLWAGTGYPGPPPPSARKPPVPAKLASEAVLTRQLIDVVAAAPADAAAAVAAFTAAGLAATLGPRPGDVVVTADAVVVGSGAGGGTAAGVLARAGLRTVVLEKGRYTKAADLPLTEAHGFPNMYERGTLYSTKDLSVNVLAGATVGGGTRINWCASFPTPDHVRAEWADKHGLPGFTSPAYDRALAAVCGRVGVTTGVAVHSNHNACLGAGLEACGEHRGEIPRNCANAADCGGCCVGCATGEKGDMTHTFLADAAAAGAWIVAGVHVERVTTERKGERGRGRKATGVVATPMPGPLTPEASLKQRLGRSWRLIVRAPLVVAAAGTMHTPALLLRSGVKGRGWVGSNLRLHPATMVYGRFPAGYTGQDPATGPGAKTGAPADVAGAIKMWEGAIMSTFSKEKASWENGGYGPMLMTPSMHVSGFSATTPWRGCAASKAFVSNVRRGEGRGGGVE